MPERQRRDGSSPGLEAIRQSSQFEVCVNGLQVVVHCAFTHAGAPAMEEDILSIIRDIQFLHDFPDDYLKPLASVATLKDYTPGGFVFREGQKNRRSFTSWSRGVFRWSSALPGWAASGSRRWGRASCWAGRPCWASAT